MNRKGNQITSKNSQIATEPRWVKPKIKNGRFTQSRQAASGCRKAAKCLCISLRILRLEYDQIFLVF